MAQLSLTELAARLAAVESSLAGLEDAMQAQGIQGVQGSEGQIVYPNGSVEKEKEPTLITFQDESWQDRFDFPSISPIGSVELVPGGGLQFTEAIAGKVDFIFREYRDLSGKSTYLCGRQVLSVNNSNAERQWGIYHKYIAANKWLQFRQTLIAAGKNVNWKLALKSPGHENPNEQELECGLAHESVGPGRIWMISMLGFGACMAAMWKQDPDQPAAAGHEPWATQQNTYGYGGHSPSGEPEGDNSAATSNPYTGVYVGDPGFTVVNPQAGDTIYSWQVSPLMVAV